MLRRLALLTFAAMLALGAIAPAPASACGGFFSDSSTTVVQQAERVLFSKNADGTLTAIVQIQYAGPSERFAWILPVPGVPDVGVSSNVAFEVLAEATAPRYQLTTRSEGSCRESASPPVDASTPTLDASDADAGAGPVAVLGEGSVGPFDWVLISADAAAPDPADVAVTWLTDNGYDATAAGRELLGPYLAEGMNLIAFRLTKQATAGDIQPIRLTYAAPRPEIPIKLTAVATRPDMPVLVWVLGEARAVPTNYVGLELNDALIDWFAPSSSYDAVVGAAADEAGGQGFVTEMAGRTSSLPSLLSDAQSSWARSARADTSRTDRALVADAVAVFAAWDGLIRVARDHVPLASGQTPIQALSCIRCEESAAACAAVCPAGGQDLSAFDRAAFIDAVESEVIAPVRDTDALLRSRPYVTRFYTNLSAAEMTLDPDFDFNPSLPDVSNVHRAERVIECTRAVYPSEAPSSVTLPDGRVVRVAGGGGWPFTPRASMPANRLVVRLATRGAAVTVRDNGDEIDRVLSAHNAEVPPAPSDPPDGGFADGSVGDAGDAGDAGALPPDYVEGACSVGFGDRHGAGTAFAFALLLISVGLRRRRR